MLAQVGRVRHQRRHSDVSLANAVPEHLTPRRTGRQRPAPRTGSSLSVTPCFPLSPPPGLPSGGGGFCGSQVVVCGPGSQSQQPLFATPQPKPRPQKEASL